MRRYVGRRSDDGTVTVEVEAEEQGRRALPVRLDLYNHSPDGFEWGYAGSGPAQLALAILAHHLNRNHADLTGVRASDEAHASADHVAVGLHQRFKFDVVARLTPAGFTLEDRFISEWLARISVARRGAAGEAVAS